TEGINPFGSAGFPWAGVAPVTPSRGLFPKGASVSRPSIFVMRRGRDADLAVTAVVNYGADMELVGSIVRYQDGTANVIDDIAVLGGETVSRTSDGQGLKITAAYHTADDPNCCPVRDYSFELRCDAPPVSFPACKTSRDTRPWLGLEVL